MAVVAWTAAMAGQLEEALGPAFSRAFSLPPEPRDLRYALQERGLPAGRINYSYTPDPATGEAIVAIRAEGSREGISGRFDLSARISNQGDLLGLTFIARAPRKEFPVTGVFNLGTLAVTTPARESPLSLPLPSGSGRALLAPLLPLDPGLRKQFPFQIPGRGGVLAVTLDPDGTVSALEYEDWRILRLP